MLTLDVDGLGGGGGLISLPSLLSLRPIGKAARAPASGFRSPPRDIYLRSHALQLQNITAPQPQQQLFSDECHP